MPSSPLLQTKASARLARRHRTGLHTHCGETYAENAFSMEKFGRRPLQYLLDCGWDYAGTWLAHGTHFNDTELAQLAELKIGVAHCPNANMRLGSGICRVPEMLQQGIQVGIGVDGSASNDLAAFPTEDLYDNGAENPVDALLICHPPQVAELVVGGRVRVEQGRIPGLDLPELRNRHAARAREFHLA
jgi:8-oxoguanine deaminase